jgi:signal transduction histidine kinase
MAREIHDELAQALTALRMDISWLSKKLPKDQKTLLEKTRAMTKLTDTTIKTVKKISTELRPGLLDDLGLIAAIEWQTEEFQNRTGVTCRIDVDPEDIIVEEKRSTTLFRIFQETLTNIARHAKATRVTASLKEKAGRLELKVKDNGKGITEKQISDHKSFGLIGIRERAKDWGGEMKIKGVPGKGTTVVVRIPVEEISRKGAKDAK